MSANESKRLVENAVTLFQEGRFQESEELLSAMFFAAPLSRGLIDLLLDALFAQRKFREGIRFAQHYLALQPTNHKVRLTLLGFYFALGDWENIYVAYEHRFHVFPNLVPATISPEVASRARWYGDRLPHHLLLFGEQGLGDVILFAHFIPTLVSRRTAVTLVRSTRSFPVVIDDIERATASFKR